MRPYPISLPALLAAAVLWAPGQATADPPAPAAVPAAPASAGGGLEDEGAPWRLALKDALRLGLEAHRGLQAARYDAPIAHAGWQAAWASFDTLLTADLTYAHEEEPTSLVFLGASEIRTDRVSGSAGLSRTLPTGGRVALLYRADRIDTDSPSAVLGRYWTPGLSVELTQPLLRGAGDVALLEVRRAHTRHAAARAGYSAATETVLLAIVEAWWELAFADANLAAREKSETVAAELLRDEEARLEAEVSTPLDVAEARAGVERRRSDRLAAENLRATAQDAVLALIAPFGPGRRVARRIAQADALAEAPAGLPTPADAERFIGLGLRGRPELAQSRAGLVERGLDVWAAQDELRPRLDLTASVGSDALGRGGDAHEDLLAGEALSGAIGLEFSMFLGQRAAKARWRAAGWARRQAELLHQELENQVVLEVRAALRDVLTASAQVRAGESEVESALANLEGEQLKREQGKSTPFQVLLKEDDHTQALTRLARARADLHKGMARLWRATGGLGEAVGLVPPAWPPCR